MLSGGVKMVAVALTDIGQRHAASVASYHRILHHIANVRLALHRSTVMELSRNSQRDHDMLREVLEPGVFCLDLHDKKTPKLLRN